jgi:alpha-methylacyl-CoA racemase
VPDWPEISERFAATFRTRTRDEWSEIFEGTDACVAPVLSMLEAPLHPHNVARGTFVNHHGTGHPAPAPRFDGAGASQPDQLEPGQHTDEVLAQLGYARERISELRAGGAIGD